MKEILDLIGTCVVYILIICIAIYGSVRAIAEAMYLIDDVIEHFDWKKKSRK